VIGNTFKNTNHPIERASLEPGGKRPLHLRNVYIEEARDATGHNISAASPLVDPKMERARIFPQESSVEIDLGTEHIPHGQITTFTVNDRDVGGAEVVFSTTNPTYNVAQEHRLTDGESLRLRYDQDAGYWVELQ
jgi:hypothetical protein